MSDLQDVIVANAIKAYNEGFSRGQMAERERIIALLEECIRTCKEFIQPGDCDYCVAQYDAIEMINEVSE